MLSCITVARYILSKDPNRCVFNTKNLITKNNRKFYEGNARLNKYLHLIQNVYIAKYGRPLICDDLYAYDNGGVVPKVQENYAILINENTPVEQNISGTDAIFLDKMCKALETATLDELIELSHEDPEWKAKNHYFNKADQKMESMKYVEAYKEQYADFVKILDRMNV